MARAWLAGLPWPLKAAGVVVGAVGVRELVARATEKSLKGEVAVVTGGGSGIGRLLCLSLAAEGARVAIWDVNGVAADAVANEIRAAGGDARSYVGDVSDRVAVYALAGGSGTVLHAWPLEVNLACAVRAFRCQTAFGATSGG